ncbi:hypothetical protein ACM66B_003303 [Microbotryomycetes sp. NB124-2]
MTTRYQPLGFVSVDRPLPPAITQPSPSPDCGRRLKAAAKLAVAFGLIAGVLLVTCATEYGQQATDKLQRFVARPSLFEPASAASHTIAKCVLIQEGGLNSGGYGDQLRLTHRAEFMAQVLGCDFLRTYTRSDHGYVGSDLFATSSAEISLASHRTCNVNQVLNVSLVEGHDTNCTPKLIGDTSECNIYTYKPRDRLYGTNKLACVADRLRNKLAVPITRSRPGCTSGYGAIHYRYGDVATWTVDFRTLSVAELDEAIGQIKAFHGFTDNCVVVYAESYPHERIEGATEGHVVDNRTDPIQAMSEMAGAKVLYASASGFMFPVVLLFDGKQIIAATGYKQRFEGLLRSGVELIESGFERI